jgi:ribosomal protein S6--L-glutamate ligase
MKIGITTIAKDSYAVPNLERLIEEASNRGHEVIKIRYPECSLGFIENKATIYYRGAELPKLDAVIPWVVQGEFRYGIKVLRQFEAMGIFLLNPAYAFAESADKVSTYQRLMNHGINTIDTYYFINADESSHVQERLKTDEGIVIKTTCGMHGRGVMLVEEQKDVEQITQILCVNNIDFLSQKFVRESSGTDIRAYIVGGRVVAVMRRQSKDGDFRANLSLGGVGTVTELTSYEENLVISAVKAVGLNCAGVDIMRTPDGSVVVELNASAGFCIEKITGINVAGEIIRFIEQKIG